MLIFAMVSAFIVSQPQACDKDGGTMCTLKKTLYGAKQAAAAWQKF
jgi:hypothetical protein